MFLIELFSRVSPVEGETTPLTRIELLLADNAIFELVPSIPVKRGTVASMRTVMEFLQLNALKSEGRHGPLFFLLFLTAWALAIRAEKQPMAPRHCSMESPIVWIFHTLVTTLKVNCRIRNVGN